MAGAPFGWMSPVTDPMVVPLGDGWSVGLTWPLVQSTVTKGARAASEDWIADGFAEAAGAEAAGAEAARDAAAEDPDTRSSVCWPQPETVRIRTAAPAAASMGFFTPSA
jgi:hypothetical protein